MNLFKLSFRNIKRSIQDYLVYFITLIVAVSLFYVFNAVSDQSMLNELTMSGQKIMELNRTLTTGVSILAVVVMAELILYANRFLIKRRKKEFGVYLTLGMGKRSVAGILFRETVMVGIASLIVGIILGIFESQFMSLIVARMFELDLNEYRFTVSSTAIAKTVILFLTVYCVVLVFNTVTVSRCRLVSLLSAHKRNEKNLFRNPIIAIIMFLSGCGILVYCYYYVSQTLWDIELYFLPVIILLGIIGTFLVFWSWSGWVLSLMKKQKRLYYKNVNSFVLRQFCNSVNTSSVIMAVICLILFMTMVDINIGMVGRKSSMDSLKLRIPADASIMCIGEDVGTLFEHKGVTLSQYFDDNYVEVPVYYIDTVTLGTTIGYSETGKSMFPAAGWDMNIEVIGLEDYNKLAAMYGQEPIELGASEYTVLMSMPMLLAPMNEALSLGAPQRIGEQVLLPATENAVERFLVMSSSDYNMGIVVVPNACLADYEPVGSVMVGNYNVKGKKERMHLENEIQALFFTQEDMTSLEMLQTTDGDVSCDITIGLYYMIWENGVGVAVIISFATLYLGLISLLSCVSILALKILSDSIDSVGRYEILRKIGVDEKSLRQAKRKEVFLYFGLPLAVAILHCIFGFKFLNSFMGNLQGIIGDGSIYDGLLGTTVVVGGLYALYIAVTYSASKRIVRNVLKDQFGRHE